MAQPDVPQESVSKDRAKNAVNDMRTSAREMSGNDHHAQAAENILSYLRDINQNNLPAKDVADEVRKSKAGVVHTDATGQPTSIDFKGSHGTLVKVDLKNETVAGKNKDAWDTRFAQESKAELLKQDANTFSSADRAINGKGLLQTLSDMKHDGTSIDDVAKILEKDKTAKINRGADGSVDSIVFKASGKAEPTTLNVANETVNGMSTSDLDTKARQQSYAKKMITEAEAANHGSATAQQHLLKGLAGLNQSDFSKGVLSELEKHYHAKVQKNADGDATQVQLPFKNKDHASLTIDLEHKTLNGKDSAALKVDQTNQAVKEFNARIDDTKTVALNRSEEENARKARIALDHGKLPLSPEAKEAAKTVGDAILHGQMTDAMAVLHKYIDQPQLSAQIAPALKLLRGSDAIGADRQSVLSYNFDSQPQHMPAREWYMGAGQRKVEPAHAAYRSHFEIGDEKGRLFVGHEHGDRPASVMIPSQRRAGNWTTSTYPEYHSGQMVQQQFNKIADFELDPQPKPARYPRVF